MRTKQYNLLFTFLDIFQLVSGSDDKTIKIWDVENQVLLTLLILMPQTCKKTIRDDNIACVLRTHRGHIFSGSFKCVKVWNMDRFQLVEILPGHNHWVRAINIANGYCFSGGHNIIKVQGSLRANNRRFGTWQVLNALKQ